MSFFTMLNATTGLSETKISIAELKFALRMRRDNLSKWFYI